MQARAIARHMAGQQTAHGEEQKANQKASYATQPGNVAQDGSDGDGPYATALATALQQPGFELFQVFNQTGLAVAAATGGEQQPWMSNSPIRGQIFFVPPGSTVTIQTPEKPDDQETVFWKSIQNSGDTRSYQAYLQRYPTGAFSSLAKLRIESLASAPIHAEDAPPAATGANGRTVVSRQQTIRRTATPGQEVKIFTYASFNRQCQSNNQPQITLRIRPAHGTVAIRPGQSTVSVIREGAPDCTGKTYLGTAVFYTPEPGYRGSDQFDYDVLNKDNTAHDTAIISIE